MLITVSKRVHYCRVSVASDEVSLTEWSITTDLQCPNKGYTRYSFSAIIQEFVKKKVQKYLKKK